MPGQLSDLITAGQRIQQAKAAQQDAAKQLAATIAPQRRPPAQPEPDGQHDQAHGQ